MKLHGSLIVIICCFLFQFSNLAQKRYIFSLGNSFNDIFVVCIQGLMFLVYPLLGHLADVYLTRYRTLKCGFVILVIGLVLLSLFLAISLFLEYVEIFIGNAGTIVIGVLLGILGFAITVGIGLFEANAIQFGLDHY